MTSRPRRGRCASKPNGRSPFAPKIGSSMESNGSSCITTKILADYKNRVILSIRVTLATREKVFSVNSFETVVISKSLCGPDRSVRVVSQPAI